MIRVWRLALNELRRTARDRPSFLWLLVMPVVLMWMFGGMGGGSSAPPKISLGVVNHDDGWLSEALIDELTDERINLVRFTPEEYEQAENKVRVLVIPEGFTREAIAGAQQELRLEKEAGASQEFSMAAEVNLVRAIVRIVSRLAEMGDPGDPADPEASAAARATYDELGARGSLVRLSVETAGQGRPVPSGKAQSVPGTLTFTVMMMTLIYGAVWLTMERQYGMLRRQASLPLSRRQIYLGKLGGRLLLAAVQIVILVAVGRWVFGVYWGPSPLALALMMASYAFAVGSLSTLLGSVVRTEGQASSIGWLLGMVLAALGGCWWPAEIMPRWMWNVAHVLPTAWAMDGFHALISFGRGLDGVLLPAAVLAGFGLLFSLLAARFLRFD
jgi:ABC-type multidrug transport system permease subunit